MTLAPAQARPAFASAAGTLVVAGAALACLLPPLNERVLPYPVLTVAVAIGLAVAIVLHLVYVGIAARRMGRSVVFWVLGALLLFPLASIVALIVFDWNAEAPQQPGEAG